MIGKQKVIVENKRKVKYTFELKRQVTIVQGESGSGKTTLYNMIRNFSENGIQSGVKITSQKDCIVLYDKKLWQAQLQSIKDSIVFIDEGSTFVTSKEFAHEVKLSSNYYVIFSRDPLHSLPYSVEEIYRIKTEGLKHSFENYYFSVKHRFSNIENSINSFDTIIIEDSDSGFVFYEKFYKDTEIKCESSYGNGNIFSLLKKYITDKTQKKILVIADGAAFGSEMNRVLKLQKENSEKIEIILPESFEWLILKSGLVSKVDLKEILSRTSEYVDSEKFETWEQYFTDLLQQITLGDKLKQYSKSNLKEFYINLTNAKKIVKEIGLS
ncbi:MAG: translation initiation factor 2 [bacterium]|nr:translation initiation factor 2 [bacterium]